MPANRNPQPVAVQIWNLLLIELTNWRWSWRSMIVLGTVAPLLSMLGLSVFARDAGAEALSYVLTGNIVLALMFGIMNNVQSHIIFMRFMGTLEYFGTLPVRKSALILAIVLAFFLLALPAVLVTAVVGSWLLAVPLRPSFWLLLVVPICTIPLSGVGALIGILARTQAEAGTISTLLTLLMLGIGPVVIPPDRLPPILLKLGWVSPATYAASALRQTLLGVITPRLWLDLGVMLLLGGIIFWLVDRKMDWRQG
jgi:ABC-2 type transport system permease protein